MHAHNRDRVEIDAFQASDIDRPHARGRARPAERQDPARLAEIVFRRLGVELIERHVFEWRLEAEAIRLDAMHKAAALAADRAIADAHMIEIGIDLEAYAPAMA